MITKEIFYILTLCLICNLSFSQNRDTLYVKYEKNNNLIDLKRRGNSDLVVFKILKDRFKTKKQQDIFYKSVKAQGIPHQSFHLVFYAVKTPILKVSINTLKLTPIENISKWEEKIGHRTKIFFIEKINCREYLIHETRMQFEE